MPWVYFWKDTKVEANELLEGITDSHFNTSLTLLREKLSRSYDIITLIDLADVTDSPEQMCKVLDAHRRDHFLPDQRLIFYTSHKISDALLNHLYESVSIIDISPCFIMICNPIDIKDLIQSAFTKFPVLGHCFDFLQVALEPTKPLNVTFTISDTLCPMPWMHIHINNVGKINACCVYKDAVHDIKYDDVQSVFASSESWQTLRQELKSGIKATGCADCWNKEQTGLTSNRVRHLRYFKRDLLLHWFDRPTITSIDLKPGNTCNFKCRICSPHSSSLFAQEQAKIKNMPVVSTPQWIDNWGFDQFENLLPNLRNLDLYGGEPFLIKRLESLLEMCVDKDHASHIRLHYNTNGSIYPSRLLDLWAHFAEVDIQVSIDNIGQRFELERGGSWKEVDQNVKNLINQKPSNTRISIMPAISIMNIYYLDELFAWAKELNLPINPLYVVNPKEYSIKNLTSAAKLMIKEKFKNSAWSEMKSILETIDQSQDSDGYQFCETTKKFDTFRNQNFSQSHKEIAITMGYIQ